MNPVALAVMLSAMLTSAASQRFYQEAVWSPDSATLLLSRHDGERYHLERIQVDGTGWAQLTQGPDCWASWSPDGKRFVFQSGRNGNPDLYVANADGSDAHPLLGTEAKETHPTWSPDGRRIAFVSDGDGEERVYVMKVDGGVPVGVGAGKGKEHNPAWSPDGNRLAYFSTEEDEDWIYVVDVDSTKSRRVVKGVYPAWSADGSKVFFDRDRSIWTIAPTGGAETLFVEDGFRAQPSPDGKWVAIIRGRWPASEVVILNADGTQPRVLTGKR